MVVLAILAATMGLVVQRIDNRNNQMRAAVRDLAGLTRDLHNKSRLQGVTYRIVIDMKEGPESNEPHSFWVEKASGAILLTSEQMKKSLAERQREERDRLQGSQDTASSPGGFAPDTSIFKEPKRLSPPLVFEAVEIVGLDAPVQEGLAYIYFFPQGLSQEAAIHLRFSETGRWTVATNPLTGRSDILNRHVPLSDLRREAL